MKEISLRALAKINLGLDVLGKRQDGYHEVRMIMQTVQLYDQIIIHKTDKQEIKVKTNLHYLPSNENNLVYKAAKLLMDEFRITNGVSIHLKKVIPVAAGLAGGSSDAAAVFVGLNRMFHLDLSQKQLMEYGVKIGADVPYCIMRGTALAEGIGEKLTKLDGMPKCHILIAKPQIYVSTPLVYKNLRMDEIKEHPDIDGQMEALRCKDLEKTAGLMGNVLETVTIPAYPVIGQIKHEMKKYGALNAMMSGSGPTVFGIYDDKTKAKQAYEKLSRENLAKQIYITRVYNNGGDTNDR